MPITRPAELIGSMRALAESCVASGHSWADDMNAPGVTGTGPYPQNVDGRRRMSTAQTYVAQARSWPNLTLRADLEVDKLVVDSSIIAVPVRA